MRKYEKHFFRQRPAWWPENEAWPPAAPPGRMRRGRFFRRMGCMLLLFNLGISAVFILLFGLAAHFLGFLRVPDALIRALPAVLLAVFVVFGLLAWGARGLRHLSAPLGDLVEAADRLAERDYTVRVSEQGPLEVRSLARAFNAMVSRLQSTDRERRDLLADITHELRTPLTVIQGNLEGMLDGVYEADEARLKSLLEETQVLSRLVEDLRTLALAESGALQLKKEPTDLAVLVGETATAFRAQAGAAGVDLCTETPPNAAPVSIDAERIRQVLSNLVTNALRYTPPGGNITLRLEMTTQDGRGFALISVEDSGKGIPAEDLPHIFDRFYKARDSSGIGLGLSIAKNLVEAHGGNLEAESVVGKGTQMRFRLPAGE